MTRAAKPKPPHEQDVEAAAIAAKATAFTAFLFCGQGQRYRREAGSFVEAVDAAKELERIHETTRRALVYALGPVGRAIEVDEAVARLAGFPEEAIARLFDRG